MTGSRPRTGRSIALCLAALALLTAADLASKHWARETLSEAKPASVAPPVCAPDLRGERGMQRRRLDPLVLVEGELELRYAENCGAAFSLFETGPRWLRTGLFTLAALGFTTLLLWTYARGNGGRLFAVAVPTMASGALGNFYDRIQFGYVTDFIHYHGLFEYPTFNVADIAVTVGGVLLFVDVFLSGRRPLANERRAETAAT